jgi:hypothetical protein
MVKLKILKEMIRLSMMGFVLLLCAASCAQNKKNMNSRAEELLGNLYKNVQYRDSAVNYHIDLQIGGCIFEMLVNDFFVYRYGGRLGITKNNIKTSNMINNIAVTVLNKSEKNLVDGVVPLLKDSNSIIVAKAKQYYSLLKHKQTNDL